jgi:hypothetical protein
MTRSRSFEDLKQDVKNMGLLLFRTRDELRAEFKNYINSNLIDSVKEQMMESNWIQGMIESAVKNTRLIKELELTRLFLKEEKETKKAFRAENTRLQSELSGLSQGKNQRFDMLLNRVNQLENVVKEQRKIIDVLHKNNQILVQDLKSLNIATSVVFTYMKSQGVTQSDFDEYHKSTINGSNVPPNPKTPPKKTESSEPIKVKRKDIEDQGCIVIDRPRDFEREAFRDSVQLYGISSRRLSEILGVNYNQPSRVVGRIQDYIKEKHPTKQVYIKVKLVKYGKNGADKILYFPLPTTRNFLDIDPQKILPWSPEVRQAVLNETAIIED